MVERNYRIDNMVIRYKRKNQKSWRRLSLLAVLVILVLANVVTLYLLKEHAADNYKLRETIEGFSNTVGMIDEALRNGDYQKVFRSITQAKKQLADLSPTVAKSRQMPAAPLLELAKVTQYKASEQPPPPVAPPSKPEGIPKAFALAPEGEHLILCEKERKTLSVYLAEKDRFTLLKHYPCVVGANNHEKKRPNDFATPVGTYFTIHFIPGRSLPDIYGYGAFVLNYPNYLDRKAGKKGSGIWIHGHSPEKTIGNDIPDSKGCIVISNDAMKELAATIRAEGTSVVIVDKALYVNGQEHNPVRKEVKDFMNSWCRAWESMNIDRFMSHYAPEFVNSEGMGYQSYKNQKEKVNRGKKYIHVKTDQMTVVIPQEAEGKTAVVRFVQRYQSSNFNSDSKKIFYLSKGQKGWQIIGESTF